MIAVAMKLEEFSCNMSLLFYSFLNDCCDIPGDTSAYVSEIKAGRLQQAIIDDRIEEARLKLMTYSKGLLEVVGRPGKVAFTHRSVCDFLRQEKPQKLIAKHTATFDIQRAICLSFLAEFCALEDPFHCSPEPILLICKADWREHQTPYLLDLIDTEVHRMQEERGGEVIRLTVLDDFWSMIDDQDARRWGNSGGLTCEAARAGFIEYVQWKLNHPLSEEEAVRLCITCMLSWIDSENSGALSILEQMLTSRLPPNKPGGGWTIWLVVLMACIDYDLKLVRRSTSRLSRLIEVFFLHGAETRISFRPEYGVLTKRRRGSRGGYEQLLYVGEEQTSYMFSQPIYTAMRGCFSSMSDELSLRDLIDEMCLHDAERLKAKIDEKLMDQHSGLEDCTCKAETPRLMDSTNVGNRRIPWAQSFKLPWPMIMAVIGQYVTSLARSID